MQEAKDELHSDERSIEVINPDLGKRYRKIRGRSALWVAAKSAEVQTIIEPCLYVECG